MYILMNINKQIKEVIYNKNKQQQSHKKLKSIMYDLDRECNPSLCQMRNNDVCYYIGGSNLIQSVKKMPHHYHKQTHITELVENICRELFYYSSSLQKISAKYEQTMVRSVLLENIKRIIVHNGDKFGLIKEQKIFYLIVSYLHSKISNVSNLREYLIEVHFMLTSNVWQQVNEEIPFSLVMLLNGQYEELLNYCRQELIFKSPSQHIQLLIDLLVYKIEDKQQQGSNNNDSINTNNNLYNNINNNNINNNNTLNTGYKLLGQSVNDSEWMKSLLIDMGRKRGDLFDMFESKQQIQILLGIISGNISVIEQVSKGSWGIYLNLYINYYVSNIHYQMSRQSTGGGSYQSIITSYLQKYFNKHNNINNNNNININNNNNINNTYNISQLQHILIKLINSSCKQNKYSFHEIYQSSFNLLSPIITNLIGLLLMECKVVDLYSIWNNKEYYQEIILNLVDTCNGVSWSAFVHIIGFVKNTEYFKQSNNQKNNNNNKDKDKETLWQSFMYQHLPYQIEIDNTNNNSLQTQIKEIQDKLQDLNIVGLSLITKTYLTTLFDLQLNPTNSNNHLTEPILQLFFLTLQMTDSSTANSSFHKIKTFLTQYYRNSQFNYNLLDTLENIFQRKRAILSEKMESKIEKLFSLPYKIKSIYQIHIIQNKETLQQQKQTLLKQIKDFNKLFHTSKNKKTISLSVELLKLASILHQSIETTIGFSTQVKMDLETNQEKSDQLSLNLVKQFQKNLTNYLQQWKTYDIQHLNTESLSQTAFKQLAYFDQYFY